MAEASRKTQRLVAGSDAMRWAASTRPVPSSAHPPQMPQATNPGSASWPLAATNEGTKFRSLLVFGKTMAAGDPTSYSKEELSEVLGRPDFVQTSVMFKNVQGVPQLPQPCCGRRGRNASATRHRQW